MPTLRGGTAAPTSSSRFFRNGTFFAPSPLGLFSLLPSFHHTPLIPPNLSMCCTPMPLSSYYPIPKSTVVRPHSVDLFISPTCPAETTTIPFTACLSVRFFTSKRRERKRERERGEGVIKKTKQIKEIQGNNYMPLLSMNPVLAVSQLQNLWTNLEACKVPHYSSRGGVFQEQLAWMATIHREGFVRLRTSFTG